MKKRTTVYIDEDILLILRISCNVSNVSDLVRELLEAYIFDASGEDLQAIKQEQVRSLTQSLRKKREEQRTILQEKESADNARTQQLQERIKVFASEAGIFFSDQEGWYRKLPDLDPYGDQIPAWERAVREISSHCGFPVTIEEAQAFVKSRGFE